MRSLIITVPVVTVSWLNRSRPRWGPWVVPSLHYATYPESGESSGRLSVGYREGNPLSNDEIKALQRELEPRFRNACLRAFVAADDPGDRLYLSYRFTLDPEVYPAELHPVAAMAARKADEHPEQYRRGRRLISGA